MQRERDIDERIAAVIQGETRSFTALVRVAGLSPARSFRFADLRDIDLSGEDLGGYDFTGCDMRGVDFTDSLVAEACLEGAQVSAQALGRAKDVHISKFHARLRRAEMKDAEALRDLRGRMSDLRSNDVLGEIGRRSLFFAIPSLKTFWHNERWRWDMLVAASRTIDLSQVKPSEVSRLMNEQIPDLSGKTLGSILVEEQDLVIVLFALKFFDVDGRSLPATFQPAILRAAAPWPSTQPTASTRMFHALAMRHFRAGGDLMSSVWADLLHQVDSAAGIAQLLSLIPFPPPTEWLTRPRLRLNEARNERDDGHVDYYRLLLQLESVIDGAGAGSSPGVAEWNGVAMAARANAMRNVGR